MKPAQPGNPNPLRETAAVFFRLGLTSFGGPAAHIALMEDELVRRRAWLTREKFLDLNAAANLIPGPNSTELAIHAGYIRAGWPGLITAGICFILPAFLIVLGCAVIYTRYGTMPASTALLYFVKPVVIAVILQACFRLARAAVKSAALGTLAAAAFVINVLWGHELAVLFGCGILFMIYASFTRRTQRFSFWAVPIFPSAAAIAAPSAASIAPPASAALFAVFLKIGSVLFGSGYVLVSFLRSELVMKLKWLTEAQLLDAVAVGQVTPGPVFTTATFIGYLLKGFPGGAAATAGIFLPAFIFVALTVKWIPAMRKSPAFAAFLDGVNAASLALIAAAAWHLGRSVCAHPAACVLFFLSLFLLLKYQINPSWLVLAAAILGLAAGAAGLI